MHPVVVCSSLERLSRVDGPVEILLPLAVEFSCLACLLNLDPFTLPILVRHLLLVMRELRLFEKVLFREFYWA